MAGEAGFHQFFVARFTSSFLFLWILIRDLPAGCD
jgi:hypothetical protein